ncbi:methyl-accepting chemotaxis protein [Bisbaumannia pacifica]|uniref:Cache domain-containing protein n=1 Tax=Bisbaumannia pacifica TaxID=77098 RepID=A0ABD4KWL4_9GAMM|nr:methyl-accepting chemotaxis protein [Halomonas pacifica]MBH8578741.1 cache domain-containing protein [Halomonas pacifica]
MPHTDRPKTLRSLSLQTKILVLTLLPLLVATTSLITMAALNQRAATQESLAEQRRQLIEARKQSIRDVVETAHSALQPVLDAPDHHDQTARDRATRILQDIRFDGNNYLFAYTYDGIAVALGDNRDMVGADASDTRTADGNYLVRDIIEVGRDGGGYYAYEWQHPDTGEVEPKQSYVADLPELGWVLGAGAYLSDIEAAMAEVEAKAAGALRRNILITTLIGLAIFGAIALLAGWLVRRTVRPIRETAAAMQNIARGQGDLTRRLAVTSGDEIGELARQFNAFVERMQETLRDVRRSTQQVHQAAGEIAHGSDELATRTDQAAANLQETSASMEEITSTVTHSAESAQQANQLVSTTSAVAREGEEAMNQVERTMTDINDSASKISEIITLIDGIAFQTNILALNASVEAARAGDHGRGFAVVAQEVRQLASRSADAAREIRVLIDTSVAHTQQGSEIVRQAGDTMRNIVESVVRVTDVIGDISAGAREQSSGIGQINTAVAEMDTMTQQNAAMVQQTSGNADEMRRHAEHLSALVDTFVLGDDGSAEAPRLAPSAAAKRPAPAATRAARSAPTHAEVEWEEL